MSRLAAALLLVCLAVAAQAAPPAGGIALSEILRRVEEQPGFIYVKSAGWKGDAWEITYYRGNGLVTERFDPRTGRARR